MSSPEFKKKFLVLNIDHFYEAAISSEEGLKVVTAIYEALNAYHIFRDNNNLRDVSKDTYYACNTDEPYAERVLDIIMTGERLKFEEERDGSHI